MNRLHTAYDDANPLALTGFTYAVPWWEEGNTTAGLACNMSNAVLDETLVSRVLGRRNGSLSGVTIRSGANPMDKLIDSTQGIILLQVYPVALFTALALYSLRLLRRTRSLDAPTEPIVRLIILSNIAIMMTLVVLFCFGGGAQGLLLPDWTRRWKTFNVTALGGSSAAVDVLLAILVGNITHQRPPLSPASHAGLFFYAALVTLDLSQGIAFIIVMDNSLSLLVLPSLLVVAEISSSAFLVWRCLALQQSVRAAVNSNIKSTNFRSVRAAVNSNIKSTTLPPVHAFHRRLVAASVSRPTLTFPYPF